MHRHLFLRLILPLLRLSRRHKIQPRHRHLFLRLVLPLLLLLLLLSRLVLLSQHLDRLIFRPETRLPNHLCHLRQNPAKVPRWNQVIHQQSPRYRQIHLRRRRLHSIPLHSIPLHFFQLHPRMPRYHRPIHLHSIPLHFCPLHFCRLHFCQHSKRW